MTSLCDDAANRTNHIVTKYRDMIRKTLEKQLQPTVNDIEEINTIVDRIGIWIEKTVNDRNPRGAEGNHEIRVNGERVLVNWTFDIFFEDIAVILESEDVVAKGKVKMWINVIWLERSVE